MCTVSFVKTNTGFILTANRDEDSRRKTLPPASYIVNNEKLIFPKDEMAGGTWIALNVNKKRVCTLLNGAFKLHKKLPKFKKSRGLVLLNALSLPNLNDFITQNYFEEVEPFTLLWIDFKEPYEMCTIELIWDGEKLHQRVLLNDTPNLWSSSTIYSEHTKQTRTELFLKYMSTLTQKSKDELFNFHSKKHGLAKSDDILMERDEHFKTVSISQLVLEKNHFSFKYFDLISKSEHNINTLLEHV